MMDKKPYVTIGKLAGINGVSADTIRYYEKLGVLSKAGRAPNGYRVYGEDTLEVLRFVCYAKVMNFTLKKIKRLLTMSHESSDTICVDILDMVEGKIGALRKIIEDMQIALIVLEHFADDCLGGQAPAKRCPSIHYLGQGGPS